MKRQGQHPHQVVQVKAGALHGFFGSEGKKVSKNPPVHHSAADHHYQHRHARQAYQPLAHILPLDLQCVMKRKDKTRACKRLGIT